MSNIDFLIQRNNLTRQNLNEEAIKNNEFLYGQYNIVSANLLNFLPEINPKTHMKLFVRLLIHKQLSKLEQGSPEALSYLKTENLHTDNLEALKSKPAIICTFHTGSYRIINTFLIKHKIPFSLTIGSSIIASEGGDYHSIYNSLFGQDEKAGFSIIQCLEP